MRRLKTNEPISIQIGTNGRWGEIMKWSTLGVRRSKAKVIGGQRCICRPCGCIILDPLESSSSPIRKAQVGVIGGVLNGFVTWIHKDSVRRWNLWIPSAGVFTEVLAGRATQITFPLKSRSFSRV